MNQASPRRAGAEPLVQGEFAFTRADFERVAGLLYAASGIHLVEAKATLVYSRLAKRLRTLRLASFRAYCDLVESPAGADERQAFLSALTTNVTRFFREPHHFEHLSARVLPALARAAAAGERVRLWSAGCSMGHEPYSMAMTVLEAIPDAARLDVKILASDIDPQVVEKARRGLYGAGDIEPVPAPLRARAFSRAGEDRFEVRPEIRALISFRTLNLMDAWPMQGRFDVIFCRNVAIYFDDATQARLWTRFAERLTPEGRLYIGHSERANARGLISDGLTVYRLGAGA